MSSPDDVAPQQSPTEEPLHSDTESVGTTPPDSIWHRIKRHKVVEWSLAYVAFAYAVLHLSVMVREALQWPLMVPRLTLYALLLGFPISVTLVWYHGHRARHRVSSIEIAILAALLGVAGSVLWFVSREAHERPPTPATAVSGAANPIARAVFSPPLHSVAVLPFLDMSERHDEEYFSDGVSEELINVLSQVQGLQVTARTSSFAFKAKNADVHTIARALNVAAILEGSIRRDHHTVRITAQLIDTGTGFNLWSQSYDRQVTNILALETDIARTVVQQLRLPLGVSAIRLEPGGTRNEEAYDSYLRGKQLAFGADDETAYLAALAEFDHAIALDPTFAAAYGRRAVALMDLRFYTDDLAHREVFRKEAKTAAARAVALAPDRADVHTASWWVRVRGDCDFRNAALEIDRALALAPGSALAHQAAALQASWLGHHDSAVREQRKAVQLDPQNFEARMVLASVLMNANRFNEALAAYDEANSIKPNAQGVSAGKAFVHLLQGQLKLAEPTCEKLAMHACSEIIRYASGDYPGADREIAGLKSRYGDMAAYDFARIYAQRKEAPLAVGWLETAARLHDPEIVWVKTDALLDPIRDQPEFKAFETRLNFPP